MTLRHLFAFAAVLVSLAVPGLASAQRMPWRRGPVQTTTVYTTPAARPVYAPPSYEMQRRAEMHRQMEMQRRAEMHRQMEMQRRMAWRRAAMQRPVVYRNPAPVYYGGGRYGRYGR